MAYIRKLKSGKWQVVVRKKGYAHITKSFLHKPTALKWGRDTESQMDKNIFEDYAGAAGTMLKEILIRYRDECTMKKKGFREELSKINLLIKHRIALNNLMRLKSHHIYKLKRELSETRKPNTVNKYIHIICHAWRVAKREWGVTLPPQNPCDQVIMERYNDARDRVLTKEEYSKLLDSCAVGNLPQLKDIVQVAYLTGARRGEILRLKRSNINFERKTCRFYDTKNGEDRTIPVADDALTILNKYKFGKKIFNVSEYRLEKHFRRARAKAEITDFRFHDLRACFATNALLSGMSIAEVAAITGHKTWAQLKRYTRIKPEDLLDKVNNIVKLNVVS